jgi:uncharacterized protein
MNLARSEFGLRNGSIHGPGHWRTVEAHGIWLAQRTNADLRVVRAFAMLHDCCRVDDGCDPGHGDRAAHFVAAARHPQLADFSECDIGLLCLAIRHHTDGETSSDTTIGTCWDADRLDLTRCGITLDADYFSTRVAKEAVLEGWFTVG